MRGRGGACAAARAPHRDLLVQAGLLEQRLPRGHEVLAEGVLLGVVGADHRREHRRHLLLRRVQLHHLAFVLERLAVRLRGTWCTARGSEAGCTTPQPASPASRVQCRPSGAALG
eukprot:3429669-Prymnesium_polylepis.1